MTARLPLAQIAGNRGIAPTGSKREPTLADVFAAVEVLTVKVDELRAEIAPGLGAAGGGARGAA